MGEKDKKTKREKRHEKKVPAEKGPPLGKRRRKKKIRRRRRLVACLVLVLIATGVVVLHAHLPDIIVGVLEGKLGVLADVGDASFSWPNSVIIKDVTVRRKSDGSDLGSVGRIKVQCRLLDLLTASVRPASVDANDVRLSLRRGMKRSFV